MDQYGGYGTTVMRLFPDYADTAIWFMGPVDYHVASISPQLTTDLRRWEASYYAGLDPDLRWKSIELHDDFDDVGQVLAQRLSLEVGNEFTVDYLLWRNDVAEWVHFRSDDPAENEVAAASFRALASAFRAEQQRKLNWREANPDVKLTAVYRRYPMAPRPPES